MHEYLGIGKITRYLTCHALVHTKPKLTLSSGERCNIENIFPIYK